MKRLVKALKACCAVTMIILLINFPESASQSVYDSMQVCIGTIIPSMFAFMTISTFIISEGLHDIIFRPLYFIFHRIIRLDRSTFGIFCLSLIGGYPVGIKLLRDRLSEDENYRRTAENSAAFCYCISPSFAVTMIGLGIFSSAEAGMLIYLSNAAACIAAAIFLGKDNIISKENHFRKNGGLIYAVHSSALSLFTVCTVIVAFNVILSMSSELLGIAGINVSQSFLGFFEISNLLKMQPEISSLPLISGISSFGGICVLVQCIAVCGKAFSLKRFLISRVPIALLSSVFCIVFLQFFEISVPASGAAQYTFEFNANEIVLPLLMAMNIILFTKRKKFTKGVEIQQKM